MKWSTVVALSILTASLTMPSFNDATASPTPTALRRMHARERSTTRPDAATLLESRFGDVPPAERAARARWAGLVRVSGKARLGGRIFAEGFRVEPGAEVVFEPGTTIYSRGDVVISSPMTALPPPSASVRESGPPTGANGASAESLVILCDEGSVLVEAHIVQVDGGDGEDVVLGGTTGQGGDGGTGGGILIECETKITIGANLVPGRGGRGGSATVTGGAGLLLSPDGETVDSACGGRGGHSGDVRLVAPTIEFLVDEDDKALGLIALRPGGVGGDAVARGGDGALSPDCLVPGGAGGDAFAIAGAAGLSSEVLVDCDELLPLEFGATDIASFDEGEDAPEGGTAFAIGGDGGAGPDCSIADCTEKGRTAGAGGPGGLALAIGGDGSPGATLGGGTGALRGRDSSGAETFPGAGGSAEAIGGVGGDGGHGEPGMKPGKGGRGGSGGKCTAFGGDGASSTLGGLSGPLAGASGGAALATAGDGGFGGDGGDCCDGRPGAKGGKAGKGGKSGKAKAKGGKGGKGRGGKGPTGIPLVLKGAAGSAGVAGAGCGAGPGVDDIRIDSFIKSTNLSVDVNSELEFFLYNEGAQASYTMTVLLDGNVIYTQAVVIPGGDPESPGFLLVEFFHTPTVANASALLEVKLDGALAYEKSIIVEP